MPRVVELPPTSEARTDGAVDGGWWHDSEEEGRIVCDLCPRACQLKPGDRAFCFVRENRDGEMVLTTYGRSTGFCIDPIEKKPLNHFYPGTSVLSFGTAGCNLGCKFCQNWDISKSREVERASQRAMPDAIAQAAHQHGCRSVAFTYNDPIIWAEYAIDCAKACHEVGIKTVAVTSGYITPVAREPFFSVMDAANVDLKAFTEQFYYKVTYSHLQPVLETLEWLQRETDVWFEITNLIIPQENDSPNEIQQMCDWILQHLGDQVPVHFTAFHPDFRMRDRPATPHETLLAAREVAGRQGLKYVYVGNVDDVRHQSTYCGGCGQLLIERNWYALGQYQLNGNRCAHCDNRIPGRFDDEPGDWGRRRLPIQITDFGRPRQQTAGETAMPAASQPPTVPAIEVNSDQEQSILRAACQVVAGALSNTAAGAAPTLQGAADLPVMGAFVTLKRRGRLRSCCGTLGRPMKLCEALEHAARRTATEDVRLPPISLRELEYLDVDVSLLHNFKPVSAKGARRVREVEIGRHGLTIQRDQQSGLLLPIVAVENGLDAETFLRQVCVKAGLPTTAWQDDKTRLQTFEAYAISGNFEREVIPELSTTNRLMSQEELQQLAGHARNNVVLLAQGATPSYYLPGCPDGTVQGLVLTIHHPGAQQPTHFSQLSLRPGLPLQATALNLCQMAGNMLKSLNLAPQQLAEIPAGLSLLTDSAMHGTVLDHDLRGVDPDHRAVLVAEGGKSCWVFDPQQTPDELLRQASEAAQVRAPELAAVYSLATQSTETAVHVSSVPQPNAGVARRPAGVAGKFYPADPAELERMITQMMPAAAETKAWPAVLVPHAGLVYSGRIAAEVLSRVKIPECVIVIGPKHTRLGVPWAVAPHETWSLPGAELQSDVELARQLADTIDGLQLDAAAHRDEHAIEVELPILARLAPSSRVVGIAVSGGNLDQCFQFANGLVQVIQALPEPPLLVISSDMNHFATDEENRRLDRMALDAMQTLDPVQLYQTVTDHKISMCGVLPAVMVMEALRQRESLHEAQEVAYATSADVSGDKSRVVGYAGMLLG